MGYGSKFIRRSRSWKRGSSRRGRPPFFPESALFGYKYFKQRTYVVLSGLVVYFAVRGCGSVGLVAGGRTAPDGQFREQMACFEGVRGAQSSLIVGSPLKDSCITSINTTLLISIELTSKKGRQNVRGNSYAYQRTETNKELECAARRKRSRHAPLN